jgi:hypothetical protein
MSYLCIKKSVPKRKVCIIIYFIKNYKLKKPQKNKKKKTFLVGFFRWFF